MIADWIRKLPNLNSWRTNIVIAYTLSKLIMKAGLSSLIIFISTYIAILILIVVSLKIMLRFYKRNISFVMTFKYTVFAAVIGNIISFIIYQTFISSGYYWGDPPILFTIIQTITILIPIASVILTLIWTIKRQLTTK